MSEETQITTDDGRVAGTWHQRLYASLKRALLGRPASVDPALRSLRATFDPSVHGIYVRLLQQEIKKKDPARNIAVSGPYGSGKSSVLVEIRRTNRKAVEIALGTVDNNSAALGGEVGPKSEGALTTETLQKEIVKRLLYAAKSSRLPRSRLNRIRPLGRARAVLLALVTGIAYFVAAWVYAIPGPAALWFATWLNPPLDASLWRSASLVADALLAAALAFGIQWIASLIRLREVKLGEFSLAREDPVQNYFDQYLDEIVYFFVATRTKIVIFEDLDRFRDWGIFVALRELNTLLNNSNAVRQPVTFIYAIGDKVFAPGQRLKGAQGTLAAGSSRAKFFDLIIPVVPFVSTETSGGLLARELIGMPPTGMPDPGLVRIAGRYFPDMRVIKSIRNELEVFHDRLILNGRLELDKDRLFSSVVYKHAFPEDHELIQFGSSKLGEVVEAIETATLQRLRWIDFEIARQRDAVGRGDAIAERAKGAGARLLDLLRLFASRRGAVVAVSVGATRVEAGELSSVQFWRTVQANPAEDLVAEYASGSITLGRSALTAVLSADLPPDKWLMEAESGATDRLDRLTDLRRDLSHARLSERLSEPRLSGMGLTRGDEGEDVQTELSFPGVVIDLVGDGLPLELLRAGWMDETFALYASSYEDSLVSAAAQNFRIQYVARRRSAPTYALSAADIAEIRERAGDSFLDEPSVLNITIFDALLEGEELDLAVRMIADGRLDSTREFVDLYLTQGTQVAKFLRRLAPIAPWILSYVASRDASVDEVAQKFALATSALARGVDYDVDAAAETQLRALVDRSLTPIGGSLTREPSQALAAILSELGMRVPSLSRLSRDARTAFAGVGAFVIDRANLASIAGERGNIGLDSLGRAGSTVLRHVLARLPEYLDVVDLSGASIIDREDELEWLIPVVAEFGSRELGEVLKRTPESARLKQLASLSLQGEVTRTVYSELARTSSFVPTVANVAQYLSVNETDEALGAFLRANDRLESADSVDEAVRATTSRILIDTPGISARTLSRVLRSINPGPIDSRGLRIADPAIASMLVTDGYLEDGPATYSALSRSSWPVREAALRASSRLREYLVEIPFSVEDLDDLLTSEAIGTDLKVLLISDPGQFEHITGSVGANQALRIAAAEELMLSATQLTALAERGADGSLVISYLAGSLDRFGDSEVTQVLLAFTDDRRRLVDGTVQWTLLDRSAGLVEVLDRLKVMGRVRKVSEQGARVRVTFA